MTKPQKKLSKKAKSPAERRAIVELVAHQQASLGGFDHWRIAYRRKCIKKGVKAPEFS